METRNDPVLIIGEAKSDPGVPRRPLHIRFTGFMKLCSGKRHAWYETNLGYPVRKELGKVRS